MTDRDGLVYVADRENHRVQIFDGKGQYQGQWNNLHRPCGLFVDRTQNGGTFYVGELGHALPVNEAVANLGPRVTVLDAKGQKVARFGGQFAGEKPGEFVAPHSVVTDSRGDVYVSEVSWTQRGPAREAAARGPQPPEVRALRLGGEVASGRYARRAGPVVGGAHPCPRRHPPGRTQGVGRDAYWLADFGLLAGGRRPVGHWKEAAGRPRDDLARLEVLERAFEVEILLACLTARPRPRSGRSTGVGLT